METLHKLIAYIVLFALVCGTLASSLDGMSQIVVLAGISTLGGVIARHG